MNADKLAQLRELFETWLASRPSFRTTVEVQAAWEGWKANTAVAAMLVEYDAQPAQAAQTDIFEAYKTWPADIREKLSLHDLRRMSGWGPSGEPGDWSIDTSTPSPILTYQKCSVIQDEQAYYVLDLIRRAAQPVGVPDGFLQHIASVCRGTIENCEPADDEEREHWGGQCLNELGEIADQIDDMLTAPQPPAQPSADAEDAEQVSGVPEGPARKTKCPQCGAPAIAQERTGAYDTWTHYTFVDSARNAEHERCQKVMCARGEPYPRTCYVCGIRGQCVVSDAEVETARAAEGDGK